ncbi:MAG: hypothetical protein AAFW95_06075 [Cyanobacteria bacterium J06638_6]
MSRLSATKPRWPLWLLGLVLLGLLGLAALYLVQPELLGRLFTAA